MTVKQFKCFLHRDPLALIKSLYWENMSMAELQLKYNDQSQMWPSAPAENTEQWLTESERSADSVGESECALKSSDFWFLRDAQKKLSGARGGPKLGGKKSVQTFQMSDRSLSTRTAPSAAPEEGAVLSWRRAFEPGCSTAGRGCPASSVTAEPVTLPLLPPL